MALTWWWMIHPSAVYYGRQCKVTPEMSKCKWNLIGELLPVLSQLILKDHAWYRTGRRPFWFWVSCWFWVLETLSITLKFRSQCQFWTWNMVDMPIVSRARIYTVYEWTSAAILLCHSLSSLRSIFAWFFFCLYCGNATVFLPISLVEELCFIIFFLVSYIWVLLRDFNVACCQNHQRWNGSKAHQEKNSNLWKSRFIILR